MATSNKLSRDQRMAEKADALFLVYRTMGPSRSLAALHQLATTTGLRIAESTLKRYSIKFEWQRRLLEIQSAESEKREHEVSKQVDDMNRQDAAMAQGMKALVIGGIRFHQDRMKSLADIRKASGKSDQQMLDMEFRDMAGMARTAQQIERLARGQATSRTEIWVDIAGTVVREFVIIFQAVNALPTEAERSREFLRLGDEMMTRYYSETTQRQLGAAKHGEYQQT